MSDFYRGFRLLGWHGHAALMHDHGSRGLAIDYLTSIAAAEQVVKADRDTT